MRDGSKGQLYFGDNLDILRRHVPDASVDLVYLDPPTSASREHNVLFHDRAGEPSAAQERALADTWTWKDAVARRFVRTVEAGGPVANALQALRLTTGDTGVLAYLTMMAPRLVELRRVMKASASIYLHCEPAISHYLRVLMDAVFESANFRNEIVWRYRRWPTPARQFQRMHDVLLFYSRTASRDRPFAPLHGAEGSSPSTRRNFGTRRQLSTSRAGRRIATAGDGESRGPALADVWDVGLLSPRARERCGYVTQKPEKLLERVILASSRPGDTVLDPFCGGGTTMVAAERLGRRWIGVDIARAAIEVTRTRVATRCAVEVAAPTGAPASVADAEALARDDPFAFQLWALELAGGTPTCHRGPDRGIDGRAYFHDEGPSSARTKQVLFSVKSGRVGVGDVRDLRGVLERERAELAVLITLRRPTAAMRSEAAEAGVYSSSTEPVARIRLMTVGELVEGRRARLPRTQPNVAARLM
jgi:site-specific DNA-methyltransferase (adenine-specific)